MRTPTLKLILKYVLPIVILGFFLVFELRPPEILQQYLGNRLLRTTAQDIEGVEIISEKEHFRLTKKQDQWFVENGLPNSLIAQASKQHVDRLLQLLLKLHPQKTRTLTAGLQKQFLVKIHGIEAPVLIRMESSLEGETLLSQWPSTPYDLLPHTFFHGSPDSLTRFRIISEETYWEVRRENKHWIVNDGSKPDSDRLERLLEIVLQLPWDRVMEARESFFIQVNLKFPDLVFELDMQEGEQQRLAIAEYAGSFYSEDPYHPTGVLRVKREELDRLKTFLGAYSRTQGSHLLDKILGQWRD